MDIFSKFKNKEEVVLVLDIGSSSVGGALFIKDKKSSPEIIFSIRESIILEEELKIDKFLDYTIKTLNKVLSKICIQALPKPKIVYCTLSSPWFSSQIRKIKLSKETPFVFSSELADKLIQKEVSIFSEELKTKGLIFNDNVRIIEVKNMNILQNGYLSKDPINQKIKKLEMTLFISLSEEIILQKFEKAIQKHFYFENKNIHFSSFSINAFSVARDMFIHQDDFLLINIGGEVVDISMIKKELIKDAISWKGGSNTIFRNLSKTLSISLQEARSLVALTQNDHLDSKNKKITDTLNNIKIEWLSKFQESLNNLTNDISIPATIFITAEKDTIEFFSEIIKIEQFSQYTLTESKFRLIFLNTEMLHGIAKLKKDVSPDSFLIIESIYINNFLR